MNPLLYDFKQCAHQAGEICSFPDGMLFRAFGLGDFLENKASATDDAPTIAVKTLRFFCEDRSPQEKVFKFGVLTVGLFLNSHYRRRKTPPQQALKDLVSILDSGDDLDEAQIRRWIESNFG